MINLLLSILSATSIYVVFKLFGKYRLDTFQAIVINYYVAAALGLVYAGEEVRSGYTWDLPWLGYAAVIGLMFIVLFYVMALTSQRYGVVVTGIATKMSMIIPAAFFIATDASEGLSPSKLMGIGVGLVAVYFASVAKGTGRDHVKAGLIPMLLFVGTGILDLMLALTQRDHLGEETAYRAFVPIPFLVAAGFGTLALIVQAFRGRLQWRLSNFIGGLVLGVVNYGSIYFLLRLLGSGIMDRSSAIPANNLGIVAFSALAGLVVFRERLSWKKLVGIGMALTAILLLTGLI